MNEDRILDKLEELGDKTTQLLIGNARIEEQMKDIPELRQRVTSLEKLRWMATGALATSSTALAGQLYSVLKGA